MIFLYSSILFLFGCALNPRYIEPNQKLKEQMDKYPQKSEQIESYQKDFENYQNYKRITENVGKAYQVYPIKGAGVYIGHPDELLGLGYTDYKYLHKISLSFICGPLKFDSNKYSYKKIIWQISERIKGEDQTDLAGKIQLVLKSETEKKFDKIVISTAKKKYTLDLAASGVVELSLDECE